MHVVDFENNYNNNNNNNILRISTSISPNTLF